MRDHLMQATTPPTRDEPAPYNAAEDVCYAATNNYK